jgi:hypothetical protein
MPWLAEDVHADARKPVLVTDDINTNGPGCLYEALGAGPGAADC